MPNQDIKKLEENVVELRIEHARQSEQIVAMNEKVDEIHETVKGISQSLTQDVKTSNKWLRSAVVKLVAVLLMAGISGAGASAAVDAMASVAVDSPATIAQPVDIIKDFE